MENNGGLCEKETGHNAPPPETAAPSKSSPPLVDFSNLSDGEVLSLLRSGQIKDHQLETKLGNFDRAVSVRRQMMEEKIGRSMDGLPHAGYAYDQVHGANCEIVVGYVPIPCGLIGPLLLDGEPVHVPMATTEGCLVASVNRGAKAITLSGGATSSLLKDGISRAPVVLLPSATAAAALKAWLDDEANWDTIRESFESTTSFGKLQAIATTVAGRNCFLRFDCFAGDAMGMNMISKGCLAVMETLKPLFPDMELISISGNLCSDKKAAAVNWLEGRGKSIVVEAVIPKKVVETTLKTNVRAMVDVAYRKNLVGSAMAGALGGFNAHAANMVTAVFLACGQDPAQNVESSSCITLLEAIPATGAGAEEGDVDLHISVTMPSIEVGTVGGGTSLPAQRKCLDIMGVAGGAKAPNKPGDNARRLARIVAATTLAGELSLLAALAANHLVQAHMTHNRKKPVK
mmetsp:Transcript_34643/g.46773  ORF Transcript_34643/g.46773 Transcript_34643/m.46773 type:complete len:459 (-) Transcript_34643:314-1690(-)